MYYSKYGKREKTQNALSLRMLCKQFELFCLRSFNRTYACASAAIKTCVRVDNVLTILFRNSFNRTFGSTSAAADAIISNLICHCNTPPY